MNNRPIGVLDSGIGGLSIWQEVNKLLPKESTIYIADSGNCPYGSKSKEEIYRLSKHLVQFLIKQKVKLIVIACNTITVSCLDKLRKDFPGTPIVGTVPVVKTASEVSKNKKIGILSTVKTAKSKYQRDLIKKFAGDCSIINLGTNELVTIIEKGEFKGEKLEKILKLVLSPFQKAKIDVLALGCTHFPFLKDQMQKILGPEVQLLDSGGAIARQVKRVLLNNNHLSSLKKPEYIFYTTGDKNTLKYLLLDFSIINKPL